MVICIGVAVAHMTRPGGLVQPPGNECTCGNWHSAHTAGSGAAMPWSSRLGHGLVLACGAIQKQHKKTNTVENTQIQFARCDIVDVIYTRIKNFKNPLCLIVKVNLGSV